MKIKTLKGHLTATEKRHIKALFGAALMEGKANRKNYLFTFENGVYTVRIKEVDNTVVIGEKTKMHTVQFEIKDQPTIKKVGIAQTVRLLNSEGKPSKKIWIRDKYVKGCDKYQLINHEDICDLKYVKGEQLCIEVEPDK